MTAETTPLDAERRLRAAVRREPGLVVLTGGQTGVDTMAAQAALKAGLAVELIFPADFRQEDGPLTQARRAGLRGARLHELSSASFSYRTWTAVYLADAVLLLDPAGGDGCAETARAAHCLGRPLLAPGAVPVAPPDVEPDVEPDVTAWLAETGCKVLMLAGCRASLLAGRGTITGLRSQLTAIMTGATEQHRRLLTAPITGRVTGPV